jgi:hypothetical protein
MAVQVGGITAFDFLKRGGGAGDSGEGSPICGMRRAHGHGLHTQLTQLTYLGLCRCTDKTRSEVMQGLDCDDPVTVAVTVTRGSLSPRTVGLRSVHAPAASSYACPKCSVDSGRCHVHYAPC